jgi:Mitochondrial K+-H+ exchange-related
MDVYLVPIGANEYELYFEEDEDASSPPLDDLSEGAPAASRTRWYRRPWASASRVAGKAVQTFKEMLSEAERERRQGFATVEPDGWAGRFKARARRWIAESIAEQRLLWHLRGQTAASLHYPDDLDEPGARGILRASLVRDFDRHRFWLVVDSVSFIASAALAILPGPNVIAYYFGFRMVGHYLSLRGAGVGLRDVAWTHQPSAPLSVLRRALALEPDARVRQARDVALALDLEHLATFFERTAS